MSAQPSQAPAATSLPAMSLPEWLVLAILGQQPAHGFAVAQLTAPGRPGPGLADAEGGGLPGHRPPARRGADHHRGTEPGQGPQRTVYTATRRGRGRRPLAGHPVEHVRDFRSELLLKLALLDRAGEDPAELLQRPARAPRAARRGDRGSRAPAGFDATLLAWRRATAVAALDFLDAITPVAVMQCGGQPVRSASGRSATAKKRRSRVVVGGQLPAAGRGRPAQRPSRAARPATGSRPCRAASAARPDGWNSTSRPPGRVTRASSRRPASVSGRWLTSRPRRSRPPTVGERQRAGISQESAARRRLLAGRAAASISGVRSTAMTDPRARPPRAAAAAPVRSRSRRRGPRRRPDARLGDRGPVGGKVVAELGVPGRGPAGEERLRLRDVPLAARAWRSHAIIMPMRTVTPQGRGGASAPACRRCPCQVW